TSYSAAGFDRDGIADKIRGDMAQLFPGTPMTLPAQHPEGVTAYGYLRTSVKFTLPFLELEKGFRFDEVSQVGGFGFAHEHEGAYRQLRSQVDVLYEPSQQEDSRGLRYAVDLCKDSQPNQIVLARLPKGVTLAETLANHQRLATTQPREGWEEARQF